MSEMSYTHRAPSRRGDFLCPSDLALDYRMFLLYRCRFIERDYQRMVSSRRCARCEIRRYRHDAKSAKSDGATTTTAGRWINLHFANRTRISRAHDCTAQIAFSFSLLSRYVYPLKT